MARYDISQLYGDIVQHDYRLFPYPLAGLERVQPSDGREYKIGQADTADVPEINASGAQLLYPFTFSTIDGKKKYRLPNAPMVRVEGRKNIVTTATAGRNYTVKELVSIEDWRISIRGIVFDEAITSKAGRASYPIEKLKELVELFGIGAALRVESKILEAYGISQVVIERFSVPGTEGLQGAFFYELDLLSDTDNDLVIVRNV